MRFVACSATVPNLEDVGRWLGAPSPDGIRHFGEEYRPVRLETKVLGYDPAKNDWMFERRLNERLYEVVLNHFQSKPALVFCASRDGASSAAKTLADRAKSTGRNPFISGQGQAEALREAAGRAENRQLKLLIPHGVAFHSASLDWSDRTLCESLFRDRLVTVMCSTSTLSMGVNLPAFLCVVRGTRQYAVSLFLIRMWAIRMTSCFVHRARVNIARLRGARCCRCAAERAGRSSTPRAWP